MVSFGMNKANKRSSSSQDVWGAQKPYLRDLYGEGQALFDRQKYAPGITAQRTLNDLMPAAMQGYQGLFNRGSEFAGSQGMGWLGKTLGENPYLQDAIDATQQGIYENVERYGLPQDRRSAIMAGQAGSNRQGIAEGLRLAEADKQAANIASQMRQQDLARQQQAAQALNQSQLQNYAMQNQAALGGLNAMSGLLQNTLTPYQAAWMPLQSYSGIVGGPTTLTQSSSKDTSWGFDMGFGKMFGG